jgi:single-strand DNA-binding protein
MNTITAVGRLGGDPELRFTQSGRAVCNVSIATTHRVPSKQGNNEWDETTTWLNATIWGDLGQNLAESVKKGQLVIATGRLEQRSYEATDGTKRTVFDFIVSEIGPSLRFVKAELEDVDKRSTTTSQAQDTPVYGDEEPF